MTRSAWWIVFVVSAAVFVASITAIARVARRRRQQGEALRLEVARLLQGIELEQSRRRFLRADEFSAR